VKSEKIPHPHPPTQLVTDIDGFLANKMLLYSICIVTGLTTPNRLTKTIAASQSSFNCVKLAYTYVILKAHYFYFI